MLALVPLKRLDAGKQRLAPVFNASQRARLSAAMARDVLAALTASRAVSRILLCAGSEQARELTEGTRAEFMNEQALGRTAGLNQLVKALADHFANRGETRLLVCHADLPALQSADVDAFVRTLDEARVAIAPDAREDGSNLLAWHLETGFSPRYGRDSFTRHCRQARQLGLNLAVRRPDSARLDIDSPTDALTLLRQAPFEGACHTLALLGEPEFAETLSKLDQRDNQRGATDHALY